MVGTAMAAPNQSLPYFNGLAVMNGFSIVDNSIMVFDKPQGQIVEISIICDHNCPNDGEIMRFYRDALMNLGWSHRKIGYFYKNSEELSIAIQNETNSIIATFVKK